MDAFFVGAVDRLLIFGVGLVFLGIGAFWRALKRPRPPE
jgi:hypothetical protein